MKYVSTRGEAPVLGFSDAVLAGLARDGGLYVPQDWPQFSAADIRAMRGLAYPDLAVRLLTPFLGGEIAPAIFERLAREAYATFRHEAVCPVVQLGANTFVLELFHGPTLAFKDVAMQLLARLMDHVLAERGQRATIAGATSGDTGGAAIEAFAGRDRTDIFILFPHGKVSPVQQRQMTTSIASNVHALAVEGNFDDCQSLVKDMFNDHGFRDRVALSGVNSINWARIMAQIVYYFSAAISLGSPDRPVSFTVPTGNFGDIFAGYAAKRMGLPIERLVIATNDNDILARTLALRRIPRPEASSRRPRPSMDIQVSSNFERLLFEAGGRDARGGAPIHGRAEAVRRLHGRAGGAFAHSARVRRRPHHGRRGGRHDPFYPARPAAICSTRIPPRQFTSRGKKPPGETPMIVLSTAHPAKFPAAVEAACGVRPALPDWLARNDGRDGKIHGTSIRSKNGGRLHKPSRTSGALGS